MIVKYSAQRFSSARPMPSVKKIADPMLDYRSDVFVEKLQRSDAEGNQSKSFQQFEGSDEPQAAAVPTFWHCPGFYLRNSGLYCAGFLAPFLQLRPQLGERAEFCPPANKDRDVAFQGITVVGPSHVFDMLEIVFMILFSIVQNDQAIPGVAARAPEMCLPRCVHTSAGPLRNVSTLSTAA